MIATISLRSFSLLTDVIASADEKRLVKYLFHEDNHDISIRPVLNDNTTLNVSIELTLYQLISIVRYFLFIFLRIKMCIFSVVFVLDSYFRRYFFV